MKIILIHSIYKPYARGGAEVVAQNIVDGLKKRGDEVVVITLGYQNVCEEIDGVKVYRVRPFNFFNFLDINRQPAGLRFVWHLIDMFNVVQARRVKKILLLEKPDLVYSHGLMGLGYLIPRTVKKLNIRHVHRIFDMQLIHPSGLYNEKDGMPMVEKILSPAYRYFCKKLFGSPEVLIFPSAYIRGIYDRFDFFPRSTKVVLANPVSGDVVSAGRRESDKNFNVIFLGQVEEYKGIFELLEVFKNLSPSSVLHVVGDGHDLARARLVAKDMGNIKFYGQLSHSDMNDQIWPLADLLVNPSKVTESFGMVVIEAYAHGVPVMASAIGALPELVRDGYTGYLIDSQNGAMIRRWQDKLNFVVSHPEIVAGMKENCLAEANKYSIDAYLNKFMELVETDVHPSPF